MINKMKKDELNDWLYLRGFAPDAFDGNKEKKEVLIEDLSCPDEPKINCLQFFLSLSLWVTIIYN